MTNHDLALQAIQEKLKGKVLSAREIYAVMDEISHSRLGPILTTYWSAAGFSQGFNNQELFYLVKAMVAGGTKLKLAGLVADKHSTGGLPGTRTTLILVPIMAAAGYQIPKTSSRSITTPAGTADVMEVLAPVSFSASKIKALVNEVGGCIVWGGALNLAPADDILIQVGRPLSFESFDKIVVSVMAKKVAAGATHLVIDLPLGPTMKIQHRHDADIIAQKLSWLAGRFKIKIKVDINHTFAPSGDGVGPVLEARDALRVLEQRPNRALELEKRALRLAGKLLDLCQNQPEQKQAGLERAKQLLKNGRALVKMKEIIRAQGGDAEVESSQLEPAKEKFFVKAERSGLVISIDSQQITSLCRILGAPDDKRAGIELCAKLKDDLHKNDQLFIMYSSSKYRLKEARESLKYLGIYRVK